MQLPPPRHQRPSTPTHPFTVLKLFEGHTCLIVFIQLQSKICILIRFLFDGLKEPLEGMVREN